MRLSKHICIFISGTIRAIKTDETSKYTRRPAALKQQHEPRPEGELQELFQRARNWIEKCLKSK